MSDKIWHASLLHKTGLPLPLKCIYEFLMNCRVTRETASPRKLGQINICKRLKCWAGGPQRPQRTPCGGSDANLGPRTCQLGEGVPALQIFAIVASAVRSGPVWLGLGHN